MRTDFAIKFKIHEFSFSVTDLMKVHEYYAHRSDKLTQKLTNHRTGQVCENFDPGRPRCLKGIQLTVIQTFHMYLVHISVLKI